MAININLKIEKKHLYLLSAIMVFLVGVGYVIAVNPAVHGHPGEIIGNGLMNILNSGAPGDGSQVVLRKDADYAYLWPWGTGTTINTVTVGGGTSTNLKVSGNLEVEGSCTGCGGLSDIQRVYCATTSTHRSRAECTATCPSGYQVIGGGCRSTYQWWHVIESRPSGTNAWYCEIGENWKNEQWNKIGNGYAICVKS